MKKEAKIIIAGAFMTVIGSVLIDCGIKTTGIAFVGLGIFFMSLGPMAMSIWD